MPAGAAVAVAGETRAGDRQCRARYEADGTWVPSSGLREPARGWGVARLCAPRHGPDHPATVTARLGLAPPRASDCLRPVPAPTTGSRGARAPGGRDGQSTGITARPASAVLAVVSDTSAATETASQTRRRRDMGSSSGLCEPACGWAAARLCALCPEPDHPPRFCSRSKPPQMRRFLRLTPRSSGVLPGVLVLRRAGRDGPGTPARLLSVGLEAFPPRLIRAGCREGGPGPEPAPAGLVRLSRESLRKARGPDRARGGAVQRRDRARRPGRGSADRHGRVLRAGARRGAGDRSRRVAAARPRARRAGAGPLPRHPARGVPRARGDRDAAVRGQPARGPDGHPRHPRRGAVGPGRDRHRDVDRRRARRRARARRPAARGGARRLRRRRSLPGGEARPALRRLDPARQGVPPRRSCSPGR